MSFLVMQVISLSPILSLEVFNTSCKKKPQEIF